MQIPLFAPLLLLRHGETVWNLQRRPQGRLDSPLTERGLAQAAAQARVLARLDLEGWDLRCSPLERALQTAAIALPGRGVQPDPALAEIGAGDHEGRPMSEIAREVPGYEGLGNLDRFALAPNGEGFAPFRARVAGVLQLIERPTVLVTHGLALSVLRGLVRGLDRAAMNALERPQGVVIRLDPDGSEKVLTA